jgi:uncharacterized NAD(P)/FAD-binding protein YdhS
MRHIAIIGGGFAGIATAIQLVHQSESPFQLSVINPGETFATGIAYQPYATKLLLNVNTAKMSLFPDQPEHFLDWVMLQPDYACLPRPFVAQAFLPRALYGAYLKHLWQHTLALAEQKSILIQVKPCAVVCCRPWQQQFQITLENNEQLVAEQVVLASGNTLPSNKVLPDAGIAHSRFYMQNPWQNVPASVLTASKPVLIIGNGLTMVDTVLSLRQGGFTQAVIAISRHGYGMLPHRHNGLAYPDFSAELLAATSLRQRVKIVHRHIRLVRALGVSAEPVIDAIRPYTQQLWRSLSLKDKQRFLSRVRHLWGVARHRLPLHIHDYLQQLRLDGELKIYAGRLLKIVEQPDGLQVHFSDRKTGTQHQLAVAAIINCTGPESDLRQQPHHFMYQMLQEGLIVQDSLRLGIVADPSTFIVSAADGQPQAGLFTLGGNLRGELWESTAVNELRVQAKNLAAQLVSTLKNQT